MKFKKTMSYDVSFQVESYWPEEGGMGSDSFGPIVYSLEEAIHQLELARSANPSNNEWNITCFVTTVAKKGGDKE